MAMLAAELKRLRRENEIFAAGTRDPEEATTFSLARKSMRFRLIGCGEEGFPFSVYGRPDVSASGYVA